MKKQQENSMNNMTDCIFCKIVTGNIPADKVYEDENIIAFKDIHPKAPIHLIVIPKTHIDSLSHLIKNDTETIGYLMTKLGEIAEEQGLNTGFRTIINTGPAGGQEIPHIHCHILGGKPSLGGF